MTLKEHLDQCDHLIAQIEDANQLQNEAERAEKLESLNRDVNQWAKSRDELLSNTQTHQGALLYLLEAKSRALFALVPINDTDLVTLSTPVGQVIVTLDRYQFEVETMLQLVNHQGYVNPYTKSNFSIHDQKYIQKVLKEYVAAHPGKKFNPKGNASHGGDPMPEESLDLARRLANRPTRLQPIQEDRQEIIRRYTGEEAYSSESTYSDSFYYMPAELGQWQNQPAQPQVSDNWAGDMMSREVLNAMHICFISYDQTEITFREFVTRWRDGRPLNQTANDFSASNSHTLTTLKSFGLTLNQALSEINGLNADQETALLLNYQKGLRGTHLIQWERNRFVEGRYIRLSFDEKYSQLLTFYIQNLLIQPDVAMETLMRMDRSLCHKMAYVITHSQAKIESCYASLKQDNAMTLPQFLHYWFIERKRGMEENFSADDRCMFDALKIGGFTPREAVNKMTGLNTHQVNLLLKCEQLNIPLTKEMLLSWRAPTNSFLDFRSPHSQRTEEFSQYHAKLMLFYLEKMHLSPQEAIEHLNGKTQVEAMQQRSTLEKEQKIDQRDSESRCNIF